MKQDEKMNELINKFKIVEETLRKKKEESKKSENNCNTLIKIVEDQKKLINTLSNSSRTLLSEEQNKKLIQEKENEISYFKNFISSLKTENSLKNDSIATFKKNLSKLKEENKILKVIIRSIELSQVQKDRINSINSEGANVISKVLAMISKESDHIDNYVVLSFIIN